MPYTTQFERSPNSISSYSVIWVWLSGLRLYLQSDRDKTLHRPTDDVLGACPSSGKQTRYSSILGLRLKAHTIMACCWLSSYSVMREISGEFFLPARQCSCTPSTRDNQPSGMEGIRFHFVRPVALTVQILTPDWLQHLGRNAAAAVLDEKQRMLCLAHGMERSVINDA